MNYWLQIDFERRSVDVFSCGSAVESTRSKGDFQSHSHMDDPGLIWWIIKSIKKVINVAIGFVGWSQQGWEREEKVEGRVTRKHYIQVRKCQRTNIIDKK